MTATQRDEVVPVGSPGRRSRLFSRGWRNIVLALHIIVSVGLLGDSAGFLAVAVRRLDTYRLVRSGSVRCAASVAGARVSVTGRFRAGQAECRLRVPAGRTGAVLRGTITVQVAETTHRSSYRFTVR